MAILNKDNNGYQPVNRFAPMNINVKNPLNHCPDLRIDEALLKDDEELLQLFSNPELGDAHNIRCILKELQVNGEKFIRVGACQNFDSNYGCLGHEQQGQL